MGGRLMRQADTATCAYPPTVSSSTKQARPRSHFYTQIASRIVRCASKFAQGISWIRVGVVSVAGFATRRIHLRLFSTNPLAAVAGSARRVSKPFAQGRRLARFHARGLPALRGGRTSNHVIFCTKLSYHRHPHEFVRQTIGTDLFREVSRVVLGRLRVSNSSAGQIVAGSQRRRATSGNAASY